MAGPDDQVRLQVPFDERAGFARELMSAPPAGIERAADPPLVPGSAFGRTAKAGLKISRLVRPAPLLRAAVQHAVATEWERGTIFLFTPVLLGAGALVYFSIDSEPSFSELGFGVLATGIATWLSRSRLVLHLIFSAFLCFCL